MTTLEKELALPVQDRFHIMQTNIFSYLNTNNDLLHCSANSMRRFQKGERGIGLLVDIMISSKDLPLDKTLKLMEQVFELTKEASSNGILVEGSIDGEIDYVSIRSDNWLSGVYTALQYMDKGK